MNVYIFSHVYIFAKLKKKSRQFEWTFLGYCGVQKIKVKNIVYCFWFANHFECQTLIMNLSMTVYGIENGISFFLYLVFEYG